MYISRNFIISRNLKLGLKHMACYKKKKKKYHFPFNPHKAFQRKTHTLTCICKLLKIMFSSILLDSETIQVLWIPACQ